MFEPPRCPYESCFNHDDPAPDFYEHHGSYKPLCRPRRVPRFRCKRCRRTFSRQTFRADYRDHKPHLNAPLVELLCAGVGFRKAGRLLRLSRRCTELKSRKIARHARGLDRNLRRAATEARPDPKTLRLHFDEFESYEGRRNTRPVSIAVAIESESRFLLAARAAPIRPRGKMTDQRRAAIAKDEEVYGKRPNRSIAATRAAFRLARDVSPTSERVVLQTDEKTTYQALARAVFGPDRLEHRQTPSVAPRNTSNPLFPINHTEACLRDWIGRLRRESWLVSKRRWFLNWHLRLYAAWHNWVRPRFNYDSQSPAQRLGFVRRKLRTTELTGWRQDWEGRSPHPMGNGRRVVGGPHSEVIRLPLTEVDEQLATFTLPVPI